MESQMAVDQLCHQSIECSAAGCDQLQDLLAFNFSIKCPLYGLDLTLDAPDAGKRLPFVFCCV
jgi:hypothetical protein